MKRKFAGSFIIMLSILVIVTMTASGAATTKNLSSNFTLVNLTASPATVTVDYYKPDGSAWSGSSFTSTTIAGNGGQWIVRQYSDSGLEAGKGSVVVSSSQELGSLVQLINRSGVPTSGAYTGFTAGTQKVYVPQVARNMQTATGAARSQIMIQNTGSAAATVSMKFFQGSATAVVTKSTTPIAVGATYYYDLTDDAALPDGWYSVELDAGSGGSIVAVVNSFFGNDGLMTYNAFPSTSVAAKWYIPLLYSKLGNTLNTSLVVQNLDTVQIPANDLVLRCTSGSTNLTLPYTKAVPVNASASWNSYTETRFPSAFQGSCNVASASGKKVVTLIMYRYINSSDQAAYEGIPDGSTDKTVVVPLIAKRLTNNFATAATIQNLSATQQATVTITYTPSGGGTPIVRSGVTIPAGGSIVRNFRLTGTESPEIPNNWQGSMKVVSNTPIAAYVANTYLTVNGDQFMAYRGLTIP